MEETHNNEVLENEGEGSSTVEGTKSTEENSNRFLSSPTLYLNVSEKQSDESFEGNVGESTPFVEEETTEIETSPFV